jgi:hypothetical protein
MHDWEKQLKLGKKVEKKLTKFFSHFFRIEEVPLEQDKIGVDRIFHTKNNKFKIQYKADWQLSRTGNVFIEYISVDRNNTLGWAFSCQSDYLIYHAPECMFGHTLIIPTKQITSNIQTLLYEWQHYPKGIAPNEGYNSFGLCVPLRVVFKKIKGCTLHTLREEYKKHPEMCNCLNERTLHNNPNFEITGRGTKTTTFNTLTLCKSVLS